MTRFARFVIVTAIPVCIATSSILVSTASATIQGDDICWVPDVETPVQCDDDED